METTKVQYGLKKKNKDWLLGVTITSNEDKRHCNEYTHQLDEWSGDEKPWLVDDFDKAVVAKWTSETWYNSNYDEPVNPYHPMELEIVKVVTITVVKESDDKDEIEIVNKKLKSQGYSTIKIAEYQ